MTSYLFPTGIGNAYEVCLTVTDTANGLRELLSRREAALTAVIYQEILQGAATPERYTKLQRYFRTLPFLNPAHPVKTWEAAAELYVRCRQRGFTPRSANDCLVAQIALEHGVRLLHDDRDFVLMAQVEPRLKLFQKTPL